MTEQTMTAGFAANFAGDTGAVRKARLAGRGPIDDDLSDQDNMGAAL